MKDLGNHCNVTIYTDGLAKDGTTNRGAGVVSLTNQPRNTLRENFSAMSTHQAELIALDHALKKIMNHILEEGLDSH